MNRALTLFSPTADQRYLLGEELFLETHFPMTLRQLRPDQPPKLIPEQMLFEQISAQSMMGNRLWAFYGAAGSGKSELIRWLQTRIEREQPNRKKAMIRIARHELDILSIVERFQHLLPDGFIEQSTYTRWTLARKKPRTLAKLVLLFALENLLDSDDTINMLFYRLLNPVQQHISQLLNAESEIEQVALISVEVWDAIVAETTMDIPFNYEMLRHQLTRAFRDHLLEGLSLVDTLRRLSDYFVEEQGVRPILLIDDLVQSLNVFATDLLDYFLSLESGQWDVVFGLTPAAFEDTERGRNLLQRVTQLDTIDDRVDKLWLSDERGQESYVLTELNCHQFTTRYLQVYYRLCNETPAHTLFPFNQAALIRLWRGLPQGKGKARYFLRALRELLSQDQSDELAWLETFERLAHTEFAARCQDRRLALACELYGDLLGTTDNEVILPNEIIVQFGLPADSTPVPIEPLIHITSIEQAIPELKDDENIRAVHNWLLGKPVNHQLLMGLRRGIARWLNAIIPIQQLHRDHIAKPHGVLAWRTTYLATRPPICLEGIDDDNIGIFVPRSISVIAFDLYRYATANGEERQQIGQQLAQSSELIHLQWKASNYRETLFGRFERTIGLSTAQFALTLGIFSLLTQSEVNGTITGFPSALWTDIQERRPEYTLDNPLDDRTHHMLWNTFTDFFQIRENLFDAQRITQIVRTQTVDDLLSALYRVDAVQIDDDLRLGKSHLKKVLKKIQQVIGRWLHLTHVNHLLSAEAEAVMLQLQSKGYVSFSEVTIGVLNELKKERPQLFAQIQLTLTTKPLSQSHG